LEYGVNGLTLLEAVRDLASLDDTSTIYAAEPFTENSEVLVAAEQQSRTLPKEVEERGLKYFLEVFIAREVLEDWVTDAEPTLQEKCARIIQYANTDA
jgi:hypothetical protein